MLPEAALTSFIAALLSMMNPIGNVGIFAGLTEGQAARDIRHSAWLCALASAITLLIMTWGGTQILAFFGVTVDMLRAAGGIIVLRIGLNMLSNASSHHSSPSEKDDAHARDEIGIVPMALPIVAGPGSMATVLIASQQGALLGKAEISAVIIALAAMTGLLFSFAAPIARAMGDAGMGVVTRVMGMILTAIAIGMLAEGLSKLLPGLAG